MSRQFTDGEIEATIKALAAEGAALTRASVRKRLGGGGSTRISALLKEHVASADSPTTRSGLVRTSPKGPAEEAQAVINTSAAMRVLPPAAVHAAGGDREADGGIVQLQSEIRVLKILLESERNARREEEARYARTIEALQREIEIASRGGGA
ncbi:DNA-binding protein [Bradyrhizobium sp. dw_411]|uniref:DNA-binding protein n=1 Tax=Bradyrhizobium sp. dw_411 TaxID=2720082 RepID=UPI001BD00732